MFDRIRLFPSLAVAAGILLVAKAAGLYSGVTEILPTVQAAQAASAEAGAPAAQPAPAKTGEKAAAAKKAARGAPGEENYTQEEFQLLQELSDRRAGLDQREQEVDMREQILKVAEQRVEEKLKRLKELEVRINAAFKAQEQKENAQIESLVRVYETMKPKDAARIFDTLGMDILIEVTRRMSERKIAPIMASMNPETAKALTVELATRVSEAKNPG